MMAITRSVMTTVVITLRVMIAYSLRSDLSNARRRTSEARYAVYGCSRQGLTLFKRLTPGKAPLVCHQGDVNGTTSRLKKENRAGR